MKEKLKVGLFIDSFYPMVDGVIQVVDQYATYLSEYCDVTVFTVKPRRKKKDDRAHNYNVVRSKIFQIPFVDYDLALPFMDRKYKKALKEAELDVIHIHSPFTIGKTGVKYAKKHDIPLFCTMHSQYKKDFMRSTKSKILTKFLLGYAMKVFNKCDYQYSVNKHVADIYFNEYGAKTLPDVLPNGTEFLPVCDKETANKIVDEKFSIEKDTPVFIFVGRINDIKNVFFTAKALKIVKEKGYSFKMMYVGTGQDEEKLKKLIVELGLTDDVILTGGITDRDLLAKIYSRAKLMLFPSLYDANSLVQIEAASQRTPTVFLEGSATSSTVTDGVNGYIAKNSLDDYAQKICDILDDDKGYSIVKENAFNDLYKTWREIVMSVKDLYLQKLQERNTNKEKEREQ